MPSFALISEGITDQIILERMIEEACDGFFGGEAFVNPLQPLRDATDAGTAPHGGWELVFEYCQRGVRDALATNDFVVIQIDTDEGDHPNFNLGLTQFGRDKSYIQICLEAREIIIERIGRELYDENSNRIIFAISVHSMESWLILAIFGINELKNGFNRLKRLLSRRGVKLEKSARSYALLARDIKWRDLSHVDHQTSSLGVFVEQIRLLYVPTED